MNTQNGPPTTVHANARIPAATDTVVTDRMGLDLDINQGSNEWLRLYCHFIEEVRRLDHTGPQGYRVTPVDLLLLQGSKPQSHPVLFRLSGCRAGAGCPVVAPPPNRRPVYRATGYRAGLLRPGLPEASGVFERVSGAPCAASP